MINPRFCNIWLTLRFAAVALKLIKLEVHYFNRGSAQR